MAKGKAADRIAALAGEIRTYCAANADPAQVARYARYFREGYDAWGLLDGKDPLWTSKKSEWLDRYGDLKLGGFLKLGEVLFRTGKYEEGALAIHFVAARREEFDEKSLGGVAKWFASGIGNWAHTDVLCGMLLAPLLESGHIPLDAFSAWRSSAWRYQRRAVPVAMLGLLKGASDVKPLLEFIRPMMLDSERVVHQGLGWFLRETWKKQPKPVEAFLLEWKDEAPRLIFQYATEKMPAAARARFRRQRRRTI